MKTGFVVLIILFGVGVSFGQTRTVTNADLEKYRQERLKAEKDYRENYQRLGMPSPEELDRQREESAREMTELSAKLRYEREMREYSSYQQSERARTIVVPQQYYVNDGYYRGRTVVGYSPYYYRGNWSRPRYGNYQDWRATPGGIIYEPGGRSSNIWTPRQTKAKPVFRVPRQR